MQELRRPVRYVLAGSLRQPGALPAAGVPGRAGLVGSAIANVAGQALTAALFVRALVREDAAWRPRPAALGSQLVIGRDLLLRAAVLQLSFLVAAGVAARAGTAAAGRAPDRPAAVLLPRPGARRLRDRRADARRPRARRGRPDEARATARRVALWGLGTGLLVAVVLLALRDLLLPLFTDDPAVLAEAEVVWWFLAAMQPLAGVVFALDGVLMGAGDVGYLRTVTIGSAVVGFLPLSLLAVPLGWGLAGVWTGLCLFIALRLVGVLVRVAGDRWLTAPATVRGEPRSPDADVPPGLLLVDKAGGMTSHDVVARARPGAVGAQGRPRRHPRPDGHRPAGPRRRRATRLLGYVGGHDKTYEATIRLGQTTVTDDREGEVLTTASTAHLDDDAVRRRWPPRPARCSRCRRR